MGGAYLPDALEPERNTDKGHRHQRADVKCGYWHPLNALRRFPHEDIIKDAQEVLKSLMPIDREVVAMNGRYYTLRIAPYRTTENNIRGLVITIIDSLGTAEKTQE